MFRYNYFAKPIVSTKNSFHHSKLSILECRSTNYSQYLWWYSWQIFCTTKGLLLSECSYHWQLPQMYIYIQHLLYSISKNSFTNNTAVILANTFLVLFTNSFLIMGTSNSLNLVLDPHEKELGGFIICVTITLTNSISSLVSTLLFLISVLKIEL